MSELRKVRVLINPKSGLVWSTGAMQRVLSHHWDVEGIDLSYQFSKSAEDGKAKAQRAIDDEVDTLLVVGGDGMVNTIGSSLIGSNVAMGVIPAGSGNGFARHFNIPLEPEKAAPALMNAERQKIDVGTANDRPFLTTCSMAWDAALVKAYDKSPVRGILPYVFAGVYEFFEYVPQPIEVVLDGKESLRFKDPMVFTVANLTQFGGGATIAPAACADDGALELVVIGREHVSWVLANIGRAFNGTLDRLPQVITRKFKTMEVRRVKDAPLQVDGELVEAPADVNVMVLERALTVLVPKRSTT